jgi:Ca2+-binding RTX toxin-like protein
VTRDDVQAALDGFQAPTAKQLQAAQEAFVLWADLIARPLQMVGDPGADITLSWTGGADGRAFAAPEAVLTSDPFLPVPPVTYGFTRASIWIDDSWAGLRDDVIARPDGSLLYHIVGGFGTLVQEIGHALGLSHPGAYNDDDDPKPTYAANAEFAQDERRYTIMSYFGGYKDGTGWVLDDSFDWRPSTPMLFDIAAIQALYGANPDTRTGNTTYGFNASADVPDVFDFNVNRRPLLTIYDADGIDTLDVSSDLFQTDSLGNIVTDPAGNPVRLPNPQVIDLNPGTYSSVYLLKDNVATAFGTIIENAIGGNDADTITGNDVANVLAGNGGGDVMDGKAGGDTMDGNGGADTLAGDSGNDSLFGSFGNDVMPGGSDDDIVDGGADADTVLGGDGADTVMGGSGDDRVAGGKGSDMLTGDGPGRANGTDAFVFVTGDGDDLVTDFEVTRDRLDLTGVSGVYSFGMLMERASDILGGVRLDLGGGDAVTLFGITRDQLAPGMFAFSEAPLEGGDFAIEGAEVAALPGGGVVVVRSANRNYVDTGGEILARIYDADGIGGEIFQVNGTTFGTQYAPKVVTQANGNFAVAWSSIETTRSGPAFDAGEQWLRARVFSPDGTALGDDFRLNTTPHPGTIPVSFNVYLAVGDLAPWGDDGFAAAWGTNEQSSLFSYDTVIRSRVVLGDGALPANEATSADPRPDPYTGPIFQGNYYQVPQLVRHDGDAIVAFYAREYPRTDGPAAILANRFVDGQPPSGIVGLATGQNPESLPRPPAYEDLRSTEFELVPFRDDDYLLVYTGVLQPNFLTSEGAALGDVVRGFVKYLVVTDECIGAPVTVFLDDWQPVGIGGMSGVAAARVADGSVLLTFGDGYKPDGEVRALRIGLDGLATPIRDMTGWPSDTVAPNDLGKYAGSADGLDAGGAVVTWFNIGGFGNTLTDSPRAVMLREDLQGVILGGTPDADTLVGSGFDDRISGAAGDDVLVGRAGGDTLDGREDSDTADYALSLAPVRVDLTLSVQDGAGSSHAIGDVLISIENLSGSAYADNLHGDAGANRLSGSWGDDELVGSEGDDVLAGGPGADVLMGGADSDTADYATSAAGVRVDLGTLDPQASDGDAAGDELVAIENLIGSAFADTLIGDAGPNLLFGGGGDDLLDGGPDVALRLFASSAGAIDAAVYAGPAARYQVTVQQDGTVTVRDRNYGTADYSGIDTLTRIEAIRFGDRALDLAAIVADARPPEASPDSLLVLGATEFTEAFLLSNDADPDGTALEVARFFTPRHGVLEQVDAATGIWRFTPDDGYVGSAGSTTRWPTRPATPAAARSGSSSPRRPERVRTRRRLRWPMRSRRGSTRPACSRPAASSTMTATPMATRSTWISGASSDRPAAG